MIQINKIIYDLHDAYSDGFVDGYKQGQKDSQPKWTPCSEGLPKHGQAVLAYDSANDEYEINFVLDEENGEWFWHGATAWMPLPEPYREVNGNEAD